jgi:spore coat protein H
MKRDIFILMSIAIFLFVSIGCSTEQAVDDNGVAVAANQQIPTVTPHPLTGAPDTPVAVSAKNDTQAEDEDSAADEEEIIRPEGWGEETHSNEAEPNYDVVFPQDKVNQMTITIDPENWEAMQANMTELYGERGTRMGRGGPGGGPLAPGQDGSDAAGVAPAGGNLITRLWAWISSWWSAEDVSQAGDESPPVGERPQQPPFPGNGEMPEGGQFPPQGEQGQPLFHGEVPEGGQFPPQGEQAQGGGLGRGPGGPGFGGGPGSGRENPMWVPATIEFEGHTWTNAGVRYKGNSSLMSAWNSGSVKMPLKLDFDEFEGDYPEIKNQRFYGFKQLSLANGFGDNSYMRETITYDLLEKANLVAAETAYYEVILDYGEGPVNLGLYTVIEVIDETVIERYFGNDQGNIYEGDGQAASLAEGTFDQIKSSFQKESNKKEADWSDIEALYNVLHSEERTTDPEAWRAKLESIFDVDAFLEWLAISAVLQHWDTYGGMSHNFYLYHNPDTDQLVWISWDHNLVLGGMGGGDRGGTDRRQEPAAAERPTTETQEPAAEGQQPDGRMGGPGGQQRGGGPGGGGPGGGRNVSLDKANVGDNWPLIRYLLDDRVYYERYINYLEEFNSDLFKPDELATKYQQLAELIAPYAAEEEGQDTLEAAVQSLIERTYERAEAVADFLASQL